MNGRWLFGKLLPIALGLSQIQASCSYAPPPVISQGQGGDTLGTARFNAGAEVGYGAVGSWWEARNVGNPDINSNAVGVVRLRAGVSEDLDVGVAGGIGPDSTLVVQPEVKWRFARLLDETSDDKAAFHASLVSGLGVGTAQFRYAGGSVDVGSNHPYLAPYSGVLVSGGIPELQIFSGLRLAASQTLGTTADWTLYPVLAFGVEVRPVEAIRLFAEADLAAGYTLVAPGESGILGYAAAGISFTFGRGRDK